jgi:hypothetical protein
MKIPAIFKPVGPRPKSAVEQMTEPLWKQERRENRALAIVFIVIAGIVIAYLWHGWNVESKRLERVCDAAESLADSTTYDSGQMSVATNLNRWLELQERAKANRSLGVLLTQQHRVFHEFQDACGGIRDVWFDDVWWAERVPWNTGLEKRGAQRRTGH